MGFLSKCGLSTFGLFLLVIVFSQMHLRQYPSSAAWIAFASNSDGGYEIYRMEADGSNLQRLTFDNSHNWQPTWSPDGRWIAFTSFQETNFVLHRVEANGRQRFPITVVNNDGMDHRNPIWSPDGKSIVYREIFNDRNGSIYYKTDINEFDPQVLHTTTFFQDEAVDLSPNGAYLSVQSRATDEYWTIYTINLGDETEEELAITESRSLVAPLWSPDGNHLAYFHAGNWEQSHLHTIDVDTQEVRQIGHNQGLGMRLEWSPDGKWIVYDEWVSGIFHLHRAHIESGTVERLTPQSHQEHSASWSPDGEWLVYVRRFGEDHEAIYRMRPDGTDRQRLTTAHGLYESPVWSPIIDLGWSAVQLVAIGFAAIASIIYLSVSPLRHFQTIRPQYRNDP